jgi:hypothetical protein
MPHKKSHKRSRKSMKKTMRRKRGGFYGASGAIAPGSMEWKAGQETRAPSYVRGGKRRRTRKAKKGGASYGAVSASFQGTGSRGIADYVPITTKTGEGGSALGEFNVKST